MQREWLREARRARNLTALEVAERTGIDEARIFQLERGRCRLHDREAQAFAAALGITVEQAQRGRE